jgi:flagellar basal body-associated protein FliL
MKNKRGMELPMSTIIIVILVIIVLAAVGIFFFTRFASGAGQISAGTNLAQVGITNLSNTAPSVFS